MWLTQAIHAGLFGNPVNMDLGTHSRVVTYQVSEFLVFVVGGALWYFLVGLALRSILRRFFLRSHHDTISA